MRERSSTAFRKLLTRAAGVLALGVCSFGDPYPAFKESLDMHTNHLATEQSPYLLQHAHNPVNWYPWGAEAFAKARQEDKPIFLSIGYSTCHWCHVMERESFENEEIAAVLNRYFVSIKVDREERPDVDRIYMSFVQATTGGGGWPMSVWLTPDLKPFYGGTYFPPDSRWGRPGFQTILESIAQAWQGDRQKILESSREIVGQLAAHAELGPAPGGRVDPAALESGFFVFRRTFDTQRGGFGEAPKFPRPVALNFLLRYYHRTRNAEALEMVLKTLREMAKGGMYDQLGGGFHRYSVDARWFVPHFEKMLYDQAQLATAYLEAFQITGDVNFAETARQTLDYVLRDMSGPEGGFYSAEDADSIIDPGRPDVKGEGAFYTWNFTEIEQIVGKPAADWLAYRYGATEGGNVAEDPHGEFTGKNILYQAHSLQETAEHFQKPQPEVESGVLQGIRKLLEARSRRPRPHLDDKVLTSWNGLMISALAKAGAILHEPRYAVAARRAAEFITQQMYRPADGTLLRRYRRGEAAIPGFLDDYAFFAQALLDLYETHFDLEDLRLSARLSEKQRELFEDHAQGAFFSTAAGDPSLVMRIKDDYDGAEPSGNSIAVLNLLRLAQMTGRQDFRESAERALAAFATRLTAVPVAVPQMLCALEFSLGKPRQVIVAGAKGSPETAGFLDALAARFDPDRIVLLIDSEQARETLGKSLPVLENMRMIGGKTTAYVCENYACKLPTTDLEKFAELLQ